MVREGHGSDGDSGRCVMQEQRSGFDHPRSDDVKGRQEGGYEGGFGDRGYGDRGDFGDQGIDETYQETTEDPGPASAPDGGSDEDPAPVCGQDLPGRPVADRAGG
jgi:hypothetical protein